MNRRTTILFVVLAVVFGAGGVAALAGVDAIRSTWTAIGVDAALSTTIAILEVLAAAGLLIGLRVPALGVAAATGLTVLMVGAVAYHLRAGDVAGAAAPAVLGLLTTAAVAAGVPALRTRTTTVA